MSPRSVLHPAALALTLTATAAGSADEPPAGPKARVVGILIFPGVEVLDFCGPFEVFAYAAEHPDPARPVGGRFDVRIVAATAAPVVARGGLTVVPTDSFETCPQVDVLVVPGGRGKDAARKDKAVIGWIGKQGGKAELVTSVCTGAFLLAEAGLLDGKEAATHHMAVDALRADFPKVKVLPGRRVVTDGNVVTAAGVSSGLDMTLAVVARLHGDAAARGVARIIASRFPAAEAAATPAPNTPPTPPGGTP